MYGYIVCRKSDLTKEELYRYQSVYCGLCRNLKKCYGQLERLSLNYDMTFVILFLSSLYEPKEMEEDFRCGVHPLQKKRTAENSYTDYAADMTVALTYFKCLDDWKDEKKLGQRLYGNILEKEYLKVAEKYPRQCRAISESIEELSKVEKGDLGNPDRAVNCSGKMLSELFVYREDFWSDSLRAFGFELGRFIYLIDAAMDYKEDIKKQNYNPLISLGKKPEDAEEILKMPLGNAVRIFEKLPLVQDLHLLRNILYGGVWQQYYGKFRRKENTHD